MAELDEQQLYWTFEVFASSAVELFNDKQGKPPVDPEWQLPPVLGVINPLFDKPVIVPANRYYGSDDAKDRLAATIKVLLEVPVIAAVVQVTEAWAWDLEDSDAERTEANRSEAIMVFIHTRSDTRVGRCPIDKTPEGRRARMGRLAPAHAMQEGRFSHFERATDPGDATIN